MSNVPRETWVQLTTKNYKNSSNLGWVNIGISSIALVLLGLSTILLTVVVLVSFSNLRNGTDSKVYPLIAAWIGLALVLIGLYMTYQRFKFIQNQMDFGPTASSFAKESFKGYLEALENNLKYANKLSDLVVNSLPAS